MSKNSFSKKDWYNDEYDERDNGPKIRKFKKLSEEITKKSKERTTKLKYLSDNELREILPDK